MALRPKAVRKHNHALALVGEMDASEVVGNRLYKIRCVAGFDGRQQNKFAAELGFTPDLYNKWELGRSGPTPAMCPVYAAVAICEWSDNGLTLDYIYRGRLEDVGREWRLPLKGAADRVGFVPPAHLPRSTPPRRRD